MGKGKLQLRKAGASMFDHEIEKFIRYWQQEKNCIILLSDNDGEMIMDVLYKDDGRIEKGIHIGSREDTKERILIRARNHFKGVLV